MMEDWGEADTLTFDEFERRKAEAIAQLTQDAIISQVLQIKSRMPHKNIPQKYLDDLHTLLYADDYDEDAIKEELKTGLTEGFMPIPAKEGRKSREILKYIK